MRKTAALLSFVILVLFAHAATAQYVTRPKKKEVKPDPYRGDTLLQPIPITRASWHDKIDNEQTRADKRDGKQDKIVRVGKDSASTAVLTRAIIKKVDTLQRMIENMPAIGRDNQADHMHRIRSLRAVWELMRQYSGDGRPKAGYYDTLVANMRGMLKAANEDSLMKYIKANTNFYSLNNGMVLLDGQNAERAYIYIELGKAYPMMMIKRLPEYAKDTFAGKIIKEAAKLDQKLIFNYAYSTNLSLKNAVYNTRDPLVEAIVKITSHSVSPPKAFPFLSDIYYKRKTVSEIDTIAAHPDDYFNNLVRLKMEDDSIAQKTYIDELQYRALKYYVRQMNELHEEKDEVRFKCIDSLPPTSLFYILVYGQDEIYTSSFLGTFKRLVERMAPMKGDELLDTLNQDHFRTFIRMCAGYNTLSDFLHTMDDTMRTEVMDEFISGLQSGRDDDLEGAVEVADAFGSIRDSALAAYLHNKVKENYELSYTERSKKGMIVYALLAMLFQGNRIANSDTGASVASARLKLPPINKVPYSTLTDDSGTVYQQVFFYGDKDGEDSYASFINTFKKDKNWKITEQPYWTEIASATGKKTVIYANLPLKEPEDEKALDTLAQYLDDSGIIPTIMIHRGHSYHLKVTMNKLTPDAKIVILGSCGGYHNLASVLSRSPDAHIVSSKQTGVMAVNEPILKIMNARLLEGADVNWITMWHELEGQFKNKPDVMEKFNDYVPPYKNLGATFIKAYKKMMEATTTTPTP
ncbi:MAG: hypothetical protein K0Q79_1228 [Flavipsychrobacter sp.]|jgi:hypothetical protein|nr:hypothetical protein [Flavipsychrobacter sp.]